MLIKTEEMHLSQEVLDDVNKIIKRLLGLPSTTPLAPGIDRVVNSFTTMTTSTKKPCGSCGGGKIK
jgi:hypothetical protein